MVRLRDSRPTSLPVAQQPRNPQPESIARKPYHIYVSLKSSPIRDVSLLCAAPPNGSKWRCACDRTNSPTDEPRAGVHHHGEEILRPALMGRREPGAVDRAAKPISAAASSS